MLARTLTPLLVQLRALTNDNNRLVFVPEGKQLSVVLGGGPSTATAAPAPDAGKQP
jgi:hypothetical protein